MSTADSLVVPVLKIYVKHVWFFWNFSLFEKNTYF